MLRERLAALQHEIWAHWMRYMFVQGCHRDVELDGKVQRVWIMPEEERVRWERQMGTPYDALSEEERESDRDQADKVLAILSDGGALPEEEHMSEGQHLADTLVAFFAYTDHGTLTPFTRAVSGLTAEQAAAVPAAGLRSVWAQVNHVLFWHEASLRQLHALPVAFEALGAKDGWPPPGGSSDEESWQAAVSRTVALNNEIAELVEGLTDEELGEAVVAGYVTRWQIVQSLVCHNAYHTCAIIDARRLLGLWPTGD